jgi:glycine/D-amino acid oxidase-like deaminating enzyme
MTELDQVQQWFNTNTDREYLPMLEPTLRSLWPGVDFVSMRTQPCVITRTSNSFPIIEHIGNGLFVATAGNGGGAKGSDAWGSRAADLMESRGTTGNISASGRTS